MSDVTHILSSIEQGDPAAAEQLLPLAYNGEDIVCQFLDADGVPLVEQFRISGLMGDDTIEFVQGAEAIDFSPPAEPFDLADTSGGTNGSYGSHTSYPPDPYDPAIHTQFRLFVDEHGNLVDDADGLR